ncbi:PAS-domain containing protein [Roseicella aerolata]|uniref:histidine kinase n=1 Tax=Roseicella aerolata TaxID=2883479 RepID=A0A9X1IJL1_9PROT|nr:PAS-domain containing protein [Roseicella aerolata]MCB4824255.1 PAS-domain containing protein [Roseicella aerolata]
MTQHGAADAALATALAALPLGVWVIGPDRTLAFANAAAWRITGLRADTVPPGTPLEALVRQLARHGVHGPGDPDALAAGQSGADPTRPSRRRFRRADGACFDQITTPLPEGGFVAILMEVSDPAAATATAEAPNRQLVGLLSRLHGGVAAYDAEHRLVFANPAFEALLGLPSGTVRPGTSQESLCRLLAERGAFGEAAVADCLGLDRARPCTCQCRQPDGQVLRFESQPLPDGGYILEVTDITAATRAEDEAQRRAAMLDGVLASLPHGVVVFDRDGRVAMVNAAHQAIMAGAEAAVGEHREAIARRRAEQGEYGPGDPHALALAHLNAPPRRLAPRQRTRPDGKVIDIRYAPMPDGGTVQVTTDITALHAARTEATARAGLLQAMLDNMRHGIALFGPDRRLLAANTLSSTLSGTPLEAALPGTPFEEVVAAQCRAGAFGSGPAAQAEAARIIGLDRAHPARYERTTPEGRTIEIESDPTPDGGFVVTWTDVTARARAEAKANQRTAIQAVMLDVIRHGIQLFGPDRRLIAANRLAATLSGAPEEALRPGTTHAEVLRLQQAAGVFGSGPEAEATVQWMLAMDRAQPIRYQRRNPAGRLIEVVSDPTPDGGFAITFSDITPLAAAEAAAASRAAMLQTALDNMRHGLLIYGPDSRLQAVNALALDLAGLAPEDVVPGVTLETLIRRQRDRGHFGPEPQATVMMEAMLAVDRTRSGRSERTLPDGRRVEVFSEPTPDGGFVVSFTDVTARVRAEEQARQQAGMLRDALDSMRHALMLFGPDRRLVTANRLAGPGYAIPDLRGRQGVLFDDLAREQHAAGQFGEGAEAEARLREILGFDRSRSIRYRRRQRDGRVFEIGSDPTPDGGFVLTHTDVTELAKAQSEASDRAGILQLMLDNMRHGIAQFDRDKRLVMANRLAAEFNGIEPALLQPGAHAAELAEAALRAGMITPEALQARLQDDYSKPHRHIRPRPDGRVIEIFTDPTPDGGFVATYSDITALTEAEAAARQRAGVLQVMLDSMRHAICYYGPDRRVIAANALAADLGGYPREILAPGVSLDEIIAHQLRHGSVGGDAETTAAMARKLDRSRPARYVRPNRDGRIIEVTSDPTPDGGFVITMSDITPLARAEAEAQRRAGILQAMLDHIRHGIALFDREGRILAVNPVFLALLDLPPEIMAPGGSFAGFVDHLQARGEYGEGEAGRAIAAAFKARDRRQPRRSVRTRPNGVVLEIASEPVPDGGWVLALTDVTEDRRIRAELERAKDAAEAANRAKSRFLATMSHELRTPLNAVIGFSEAITADPNPERGKEYVRSIHEAGRHLLALIDDILDVTRAETTGFPTMEGEVDVIPLVEGAVRVMQATATAAGVSVEAELPPVLPLVRADELRLRQVLLNLLSNAVKFTPGGGRVTISAAEEPEGDLVLKVADSGIGMRPEDIPRAFEPFTQLDSSLARRFSGSGLGLYLSRALAEAQGATLTLESMPGDGTTAVLRFPKSRLLTPLAA